MRLIANTSFWIVCLCLLAARSASAQGGDALIDYNLGLVAAGEGDEDGAYKLYRKACMAQDGVVDACVAWGEMAAARENTKDVKRALGSAIMFDPEDIRSRYTLALSLIEKKDWIWAIEHLEAAVPNAKTVEDASLIRYYLGYSRYKNGELEEAARQFAMASRSLPPLLDQRSSFYRGIIARELGKDEKAQALMDRVGDGPDEDLAKAAAARVSSWSAFPRVEGFAGQVIGSFGYNSHPTSSFMDDASLGDHSALESIFRGDVIFGAGEYHHGFQAHFTAYRDQYWAELGDSSEASEFELRDFNTTIFMLQLAYIGRGRAGGLEHELRIGFDTELGYMDHMPVKQGKEWLRGEDTFNMMGWAMGGRVWWSMAKDSSSVWSVRFKLEVRPNYMEDDRSTVRTRLRIMNNRWFLDHTLQLKALVGGRYDRAYLDPEVIKYDRLLPEAWLDLKWITPVPRLSGLVGGKLKYNWYMNSKKNGANSFRPTYLPNPQFSEEENLQFEQDYYSLTRHDFEWEVMVEAQVSLWSKAALGLRYIHRKRYSNLDGAPVPIVLDEDTGEYSRMETTDVGYGQDMVVLELRQRF